MKKTFWILLASFALIVTMCICAVFFYGKTSPTATDVSVDVAVSDDGDMVLDAIISDDEMMIAIADAKYEKISGINCLNVVTVMEFWNGKLPEFGSAFEFLLDSPPDAGIFMCRYLFITPSDVALYRIAEVYYCKRNPEFQILKKVSDFTTEKSGFKFAVSGSYTDSIYKAGMKIAGRK